MSYSICIIGAGPAGLIFLAALSPEIQQKTVIIDPCFAGGDLMGQWPEVTSNTTVDQILTSLKKLPFADKVPSKIDRFQTDDLCPVRMYSALISDLAQESLSIAEQRNGMVTCIERIENEWTIQLNTNAVIRAKKIVIATGMEPTILDLGMNTIPLQHALNPALLSAHCIEGIDIALFGLAHSGTVVLRNLIEKGAFVTAFYRGTTPFSFASDGSYDGIKGDADPFARSVLAGKYKDNVNLVSLQDLGAVIRAAKKCKKAVCAVGFTPRSLGNCFLREYNDVTGEIAGLENAWGIGAAFPNSTTIDGHRYKDISIPAFVEQILVRLPHILTGPKVV